MPSASRWPGRAPAGKVVEAPVITQLVADGVIVIASHYETNYPLRDINFVGANDGGATTALLIELGNYLRAAEEYAARTLRERRHVRLVVAQRGNAAGQAGLAHQIDESARQDLARVAGCGALHVRAQRLAAVVNQQQIMAVGDGLEEPDVLEHQVHGDQRHHREDRNHHVTAADTRFQGCQSAADAYLVQARDAWRGRRSCP